MSKISSILGIRIYLLSNPLHLQFVLDVLNLFTVFDPALLKILPQYKIFQACIEMEERCYKIIRKSDISKLKKQKDRERDLVIMSIRDLLKSALRSLDEVIREAAERLKIVLDAYDSPTLLIKLPFDAETAAINSLLEEFEGKYANDIQIVGLATLVKELRIRNDTFDLLAKDYNKQQAEKPSIRSTEARQNTDKVYQEMITLIDAAIINDGEAPYASFISEINTLIKHYNDLIAQHQGHLKAAKEKEKKAKEEAEKKAKEDAETNAKEETEKKSDVTPSTTTPSTTTPDTTKSNPTTTETKKEDDTNPDTTTKK
jgi:hypothetical protein